ncbi:MAG: hypothetical protein ACTSPK_03455 [Candidatus Heimdallarchaeota archaeon]
MNQQGIMLIVEFDWPEEITKELGSLVRKFHDLVTDADWIEEKVAASGGLGGDYGSIWIFRLKNYAGLDEFFHGKNEIAKSFKKWSNQMIDISISVKEEVMFL